jgi:TRAP-type C4-dicarboxylate transport system permease small subunit
LFKLAEGLAVFGGLLLLALSLLTVANVVLRGVFGTQVRGEFDLASLGGAVAIFCFLPYAQLVRAHVVVEFATGWAPSRWRASLDALASLAFALVAILLAWRLSIGALEMKIAGQESAVLRLPTWLAMLAGLPPLVLVAIAAARDAWLHWAEARG